MTRSLADVAWPVRTERLVLRAAVAGDADAMWAYRGLPEVQRWITGGQHTVEGFREHATATERLARTVVVEHEGAVVGDLMVRLGDAWAQGEVADRARCARAELGIVLHPAHAGLGLATEAAAALLRICFDDLGLHHVTAGCVVDNEASWRLMERLGMRREHHAVGQFLLRTGQWADSYGYALLADEWRARP